VLDILATYKSREEIHLDFPDLEDEDFEQALRFAAENLEETGFFMPDLPETASR
jgi:uncharacterized protein (DUF433 family)